MHHAIREKPKTGGETLLRPEYDGADHQVGHHLLLRRECRSRGSGVWHRTTHIAQLRPSILTLPWQAVCRTPSGAERHLPCHSLPKLAWTLPPSAPGVADRPSTRNLQRASRMWDTARTISELPAGLVWKVARGTTGAVGLLHKWPADRLLAHVSKLQAARCKTKPGSA